MRAEPRAQGRGRGAQSRQDLIRAAAQAFSEHGISGASTREIARAAGANVAAIGYHFGGKDGLYRAVVEHIVEVIGHRISPTLDAAEAYLRNAEASRDDSLEHIQALLSVSILSHSDIAEVSQIISHEQARPTEAFDLLYRDIFGRIQTCGASLIARYVGDRAVREEHIIRFHSLLGEALSFRYAKEVFLRRIGKSELQEREIQSVQRILNDHAKWILDGLRSRRANATAERNNPKNR